MSLHNPKRAQAKLIVSLCPSIHLRKVRRLLRVSFSTTRYHIDNLERSGEVIRFKDGRYDRLYPTGTPDSMKRVYAALRPNAARRVLGPSRARTNAS
jgi:predicted transcriptional regulator